MSGFNICLYRDERPTVHYERECIDILTVVGNFSQLALKVAYVVLKAITLPHFARVEVVVILFGLSAKGILGEECLSYLLKTMERTRRQRVEPIRGHAFQAG